MSLTFSRTWIKKNQRFALWSHRSSAVLLSLKRRLSQHLSPMICRCCHHWQHHGGVKAAVRQVYQQLIKAQYVARFDIQQYYQSMDHRVLLTQLKSMGVNERDYQTIQDYLRLPDRFNTGIGMVAGGSLSPLLAAVYLHPLDQLMTKLKKQKKILGYTRYMDDYVILCKTRWQLKKAIAKMQVVLKILRCRVHPNKRFIGNTKRRFNFLGYWFQAGRKLRASNVSINRFHNKLCRLYERGVDQERLLQYVDKWYQYHVGGLKRIISFQGGPRRHRKRSIHYLKTMGLN